MLSGHTEMRKQCTAVTLSPLLREKHENKMAEENLLDSSDIFLSYQWVFSPKKFKAKIQSKAHFIEKESTFLFFYLPA